MTTNRRQRELARAKFERQQQRRAASARRRRRGQRILAIVAIGALVIAVGALIIVPRVTEEAPAADAGMPSPSASALSASPSPLASMSESASPSPSALPSSTTAPAITCAPVPTTRPKTLSWPSAPTTAATATTLTLATNCGDIVIDLLPDAAPRTVASMQFLAEQAYFDSTDCHRVTTTGIFVLQCGDPTGTGTGGPGYQLPDENLPADGPANYPAGTVAMANAGPGTSGSQFFIVYQDTQLPPNYTVWGRVTQGLDIVQGVAAAGAYGGTGDGRPLQPITIEQASVTTG